jgi:tRNA(Ile)-lysidine synthase
VHRLAQSVLGFVRKHDLLQPGDRVGVAVSGGADSVALLRILLELRPELGIVLCVVHLNHQLRGDDSDADQEFVSKLAEARELQFICENVDAKAHASANKLSLESAARQLRYDFFNRVLVSENLGRIATAHTLDDQAETVLLKLVRGTGTRGLAGIYPSLSSQHSSPGSLRNKAVIRPLLAVRRPEIEAYLSTMKQVWREDSTNRELRHTRNRLRHEILPHLEQEINPRVREALAEAADIARSEEQYWSDKTARLLPQVWNQSKNGGSLSRDSIAQLEFAVQRRIVRAVGEALGLNFEFRHVEEILNLHEASNCASLPHGWSAVLLNREVRFERRDSEPRDYEHALSVPGRVVVPEANAVIEAVMVSAPDHQYASEHLLSKQFATKGLLVRNWRPGDRFWPANRKRPKKIKELLQDRHITGEVKKSWPVVASGDEVIWVRDFGVRRDFQVKGHEGVLITASILETVS